MIIAVFAVVGALAIFMLVSFFLTKKKYEFELDGNKITVTNVGARLKIFVDDKLIQKHDLPQLIHGEEYSFSIGERELKLRCKSSSLGYKLRVELVEDDNVLSDNGVVLRTKKKSTVDKELKLDEAKEETKTDDEGTISYPDQE